jgi:transposase
VLLVERWILAALRKRTFFTLGELNAAIRELVERLNQRAFRKLPGSRAESFAALDRPALRALPAARYDFGEWKHARVNIDYHVELQRHFYSVPYGLAEQQVDLRYSNTTVEVFHRSVRVASHRRSWQAGAATTVDEHRPPAHQRYLSWTPSRILEWASKAGSATRNVAEAILKSRPHPEQSYRSCIGLIRLGERFGQDRLEAACTRALKFDACSYQRIKAILQSGLDRQPLLEPAPAAPPLVHENIRGAAYFEDNKEDRHAY